MLHSARCSRTHAVALSFLHRQKRFAAIVFAPLILLSLSLSLPLSLSLSPLLSLFFFFSFFCFSWRSVLCFLLHFCEFQSEFPTSLACSAKQKTPEQVATRESECNMRCLSAFVAVAAAISAATAQTPPASADNIRLSFTQHGLNEVLALGSELVYDALKGGVTLPDIHIDTHVAEPLGHITLDLTDIQASWLALRKWAVGCVGSVHGRRLLLWHFRWWSFVFFTLWLQTYKLSRCAIAAGVLGRSRNSPNPLEHLT